MIKGIITMLPVFVFAIGMWGITQIDCGSCDTIGITGLILGIAMIIYAMWVALRDPARKKKDQTYALTLDQKLRRFTYDRLNFGEKFLYTHSKKKRYGFLKNGFGMERFQSYLISHDGDEINQVKSKYSI